MPAIPGIGSAYISWASYPGTQVYAIGVCEGTSRGGPGLQQFQTSGLSISVTGLKNCQWYYYEVVAIPAWQIIDSGTFQTVLPAWNLLSIVNSPSDIWFSWIPACGSLRQQQWLDIGNSPGANDVFNRKMDSVDTHSFHLPMTLMEGDYWWRINTMCDYGTWYPSDNAPLHVGPTQRRLIVYVNPRGSGATAPSGTTYWGDGTPVTISATPNAGYYFSNWSGDASGSDNPITIFMDRDKTITANFTTTPQKLPATNLKCSS
jgi:hypothetical protein